MMLQVCRLGRKITDQWLWKELSFSLEQGQCLGIQGPSGAGKTLLLRTIAGLDRWDQGEIYVEEKPLFRWSPSELRSKVIYLHQRPCFLAATVEEELKGVFSFQVHRQKSYHPQKIEEWLDWFGKSRTFLKQETSKLSGGEGQIVAFLRALQLDPSILLLDEPTASLGRASLHPWEELFRSWLHQGGRGALLVSHKEEEIERICSSSVALGGGRFSS